MNFFNTENLLIKLLSIKATCKKIKKESAKFPILDILKMSRIVIFYSFAIQKMTPTTKL